MTRTLLALVLASTCGSAAAAAEVAPASDAQIRSVILAVNRHQLRPLAAGDYTPVTTLAALQAARPPEGVAWNYPWGVTLYGMLRASDATGERPEADFAVEHGRQAARYYTFLTDEKSKLGAEALANFKSPIDQLLNLGNLDSCGAMGAALLEGILRHGGAATPDEKAVVARIADWIVNRQDRLPDGTLWRAQSNKGAEAWKPGTVWCDDLYMSCPFLIRWSESTGDPKYRDDAAQQIIHMAALLQDTDGVWYHTYFVNEGRRSPIKWGRANGWVVVATVEVLSTLPPDHPARPQLLAILRKHLAGLKRVQAPSGMWHQVLDHPEIWEETSCTAMFAYGFARAAHRGWIDPSGLDVARRAFAGVMTQVTPDGAVNGTCEGTNIGLDLAFYANRKRPPDDLHGRGVVMLAGAEILAGSRP